MDLGISWIMEFVFFLNFIGRLSEIFLKKNENKKWEIYYVVGVVIGWFWVVYVVICLGNFIVV